MKRKCPLCGSSDTAEYLYGSPAFSEELEKDAADRRVILAGCTVTGNDPSAHCNKCRKDFGRPPYVPSRKDRAEDAPRELFPDAVTGILFSEGGYFGGCDVVEITGDENGCHSVYRHLPAPDTAQPYSLDLPASAWKTLMDILFRQLCVHEWKKSYVDPHVFDGTQWSLELRLTEGRHYIIDGSNKFPPLYKDLVRTFRPYMEGDRIY